ncbi:MAG: TIGR04100 family radical SAM protein [Agathobacter sp.]|nr:TIGR04100 family radical SAM protein [Agathobacter sp.]MBQ2282896.1 TIGR04100 family radical SAM protein [Agathobacter sp.]
MADIIYTYKNQVYANITNKCDCACTFCVRSLKDAVGEATTLWHEKDPSLEEIKAAIDAFDFTGYEEFVFCGYGEPTCALENLLASAKYIKENHDLKIRLNTNGLGNLYHKRNIIPELATVIDSVSISLNAPDAESYQKVTRPQFENAYEAMLDFAEECNHTLSHTQLSIVDVLPAEDIKKCQEIADSRGVYLKVRKYS